MTLTPEQKKTVSDWVAAGDNLSAIQKKLSEQFKVSMTYMDVRFLVDDLNLAIKDPAPKADANDVSKSAPAPAVAQKPAEKKGLFEKAKEKLGLAKNESEEGDAPIEGEEELPSDEADLDAAIPPGGASTVSVNVDKVTLLPNAMASGTVTFSDGVTGKWIVDNYGRPGFTEISKPGYRPSAADAQAFMQELSATLQKRGY
jgi:hypothetical protein